MSRLKELRLHGFKSFADPTRFVFEPGVNAVIGPNGSGKSNMADAVRWVLGEQSNRSLRTRRADDVIFGGSEQRKPQGMAEAILTLDNADGWLPIEFAEVSIGRRAYRSGESEYLINGARARLRDVVDLLGEGQLGANELVVVGQGTVDAALSLRPEERRQLFEEAAGVKGLQVKRNEASARLARALDNLTRVSDLVGELKPQVRRLALQAEHQQQHDTLGSRARALIGTSIRRRELAARSELSEARRRAAAAESALASYRDAQKAGREAVRVAEERYWATEQAARDAAADRQAAHEALIRLEARVEALSVRLSEMQVAVEREEHELGTAEDALANLDVRGPGAEVAPAIAAAAAAESEWRSAVTELAAADDLLVAAEQAVSELRARHSDAIAARARAVEEATQISARLEHLARERDAAAASLGDSRRRASRCRGRAGRSVRRLGLGCGGARASGCRPRRRAGGGRCHSTVRHRAHRATPGAPRGARCARPASRRGHASRAAPRRRRVADAARRGLGAGGLVAGHRGSGRWRARERAAVVRPRSDRRDRGREGCGTHPRSVRAGGRRGAGSGVCGGGCDPHRRGLDRHGRRSQGLHTNRRCAEPR